MLSVSEKRFLIDLRADPRWEAVLKYLERKPPTYTPSEDIEEEKLKSKFVYESGQFKENDRVLKILRSN